MRLEPVEIKYIIHILETMLLNSEAVNKLSKEEKYGVLNSSLDLINAETSELSLLTEDQINESFDRQCRRYTYLIGKLKQMLNEN